MKSRPAFFALIVLVASQMANSFELTYQMAEKKSSWMGVEKGDKYRIDSGDSKTEITKKKFKDINKRLNRIARGKFKRSQNAKLKNTDECRQKYTIKTSTFNETLCEYDIESKELAILMGKLSNLSKK